MKYLIQEQIDVINEKRIIKLILFSIYKYEKNKTQKLLKEIPSVDSVIQHLKKKYIINFHFSLLKKIINNETKLLKSEIINEKKSKIEKYCFD